MFFRKGVQGLPSAHVNNYEQIKINLLYDISLKQL